MILKQGPLALNGGNSVGPFFGGAGAGTYKTTDDL